MNAHAPIAPAAPARHRFTLDAALALVEHGLIDRRSEIIDGEIIDMASEGELHRNVKVLLNRLLVMSTPEPFLVVPDTTLALSAHDAPSPDFYIIEAAGLQKLIDPKAVALVIEVADTSLIYDLSRKAALYASYGLAEYWVVDLGARAVHVLANPEGSAYRDIRTQPFEAALSPRALPSLSIRFADLLGAA
jgi:Uma2 family endonuclease